MAMPKSAPRPRQAARDVLSTGRSRARASSTAGQRLRRRSSSSRPDPVAHRADVLPSFWLAVTKTARWPLKRARCVGLGVAPVDRRRRRARCTTLPPLPPTTVLPHLVERSRSSPLGLHVEPARCRRRRCRRGCWRSRCRSPAAPADGGSPSCARRPRSSATRTSPLGKRPRLDVLHAAARRERAPRAARRWSLELAVRRGLGDQRHLRRCSPRAALNFAHLERRQVRRERRAQRVQLAQHLVVLLVRVRVGVELDAHHREPVFDRCLDRLQLVELADRAPRCGSTTSCSRSAGLRPGVDGHDVVGRDRDGGILRLGDAATSCIPSPTSISEDDDRQLVAVHAELRDAADHGDHLHGRRRRPGTPRRR